MPMSWNSGSQETITSPGWMLALSHIDSMLAQRLRWVICTAFGVEVDPEVSCSSAGASSAISTSGAGPPGSPTSCSTVNASNAGPVQQFDEIGERVAQHHRPGADQRQHGGGLRRVGGQVGSRGRLVQHRHRRPGQPGGLGDRRDLERLGGQHRDGVTRPYARSRPAPWRPRRPRRAPAPSWSGRARAARPSSSRHRPAPRCAEHR